MTHSAAAAWRLGVDYGTCWSKLVLWAPEVGGAGRAYVIRPPDPGADCRVPSRIILLGRRLYFGPAAEARLQSPGAVSYPSLKARLFEPDLFDGPAPPPPEGMTVEDLVVLSIAQLLRLGSDACATLAGPPPEVALGAPGDAEGPQAQLMSRVGARALALSRLVWPDLSAGLAPSEALRLLEAAGQTQAPQIIPELDASLAWFHQSPYVRPGRYLVADIGAGFSRAACFEMDQGPAAHTNGALRCHGVVHSAFGADAIDVALARAAKVSDPTLMRGNEGTLIVRHRGEVGDEINGVRAKAMGLYRAAHALAWEAAPSDWADFGLLLIGGGSWIRVLREHLMSPARAEIPMAPSLLNAGRPDGLHEVDGRAFYGDPDFLMVAYGLARGGVPV